MLAAAAVDRHRPQFRQEVKTQIIGADVWIDFTLSEDFLLSYIHLRDLCGRCYLDIGILHTVVNHALVAVHLGTGWNMDVDDGFSLIGDDLRCEVGRRREDIRIADLADEVPHHVRSSIFCNPRNGAVVQHAKKNIAAIAVQKGADGLIDIALDAVATAFELHGDRLTDPKYGGQFICIHRCTPFAYIIDTR